MANFIINMKVYSPSFDMSSLIKNSLSLILLCQILSEHSSLNCSVVIHHTTAW
jgi:hypothetical protein